MPLDRLELVDAVAAPEPLVKHLVVLERPLEVPEATQLFTEVVAAVRELLQLPLEAQVGRVYGVEAVAAVDSQQRSQEQTAVLQFLEETAETHEVVMAFFPGEEVQGVAGL